MGKRKDRQIFPWASLVLFVALLLLILLGVEKAVETDADVLYRLGKSEASMGIPLSMERELFGLGCLKHKGARKLQSRQSAIRLEGMLCGETGDSMIQVKNLTNGYKGSVYYEKEDSNEFTTDFLLLKRGPNKIRFEWQDKGKKQVRFFIAEINRD